MLRAATEQAHRANDRRDRQAGRMVFTPLKLEPGHDDQVRERIAREEAIRQARRAEALIAKSGVPDRYRHARIGHLEAIPDDVAEAYGSTIGRLASLLDRPGMVALLGKRGAGKTWMACALVNEMCLAGRPAMFCEAMDYFVALQETYGDVGKVNASAIERRYLEPELHVLDAMEERADTAWNDRMLTRLINKRYSAMKSTVLISNEEAATFNERVGKSIEDRIRDDGGKLECRWDSLRGRIG